MFTPDSLDKVSVPSSLAVALTSPTAVSLNLATTKARDPSAEKSIVVPFNAISEAPGANAAVVKFTPIVSSVLAWATTPCWSVSALIATALLPADSVVDAPILTSLILMSCDKFNAVELTIPLSILLFTTSIKPHVSRSVWVPVATVLVSP